MLKFNLHSFSHFALAICFGLFVSSQPRGIFGGTLVADEIDLTIPDTTDTVVASNYCLLLESDSVKGIWKGTYLDAKLGNVSLRMETSVRGDSVLGHFYCDYFLLSSPNAPIIEESGAIKGTIQTDSFRLNLILSARYRLDTLVLEGHVGSLRKPKLYNTYHTVTDLGAIVPFMYGTVVSRLATHYAGGAFLVWREIMY